MEIENSSSVSRTGESSNSGIPEKKGDLGGHEVIHITDFQDLSDGKFHVTAECQGKIFSISIENAKSPEEAREFIENHIFSIIQISTSRTDSRPVKLRESEDKQLFYLSKNNQDWKGWSLVNKQSKYKDVLSFVPDQEFAISNDFARKEDLLELLSKTELNESEFLREVVSLTKNVPLTEISDDAHVQKIINKARLYSGAAKLEGARVKFIDSQSKVESEGSQRFSHLARDSSSVTEAEETDTEETEDEFDISETEEESELGVNDEVNSEKLVKYAEECMAKADKYYEDENFEMAIEEFTNAKNYYLDPNLKERNSNEIREIEKRINDCNKRINS